MWEIRLLGGLAASGRDREVHRFRTQKAAALFACLAYRCGTSAPPSPREVLAGTLWPDADTESARHNLRNALTFLRHVLEPPGVPSGAVLRADRTAVSLNPDAVVTDVFRFESAARRGLREGLPPEEGIPLLGEAADAYGGALLPGFYDDWVAPESERLSELYLRVTSSLVDRLLDQGEVGQALHYAQQGAACDPLSESAIQPLLRALFASGQRTQALRRYRAFETRLSAELSIRPSARMRDFVEEFRRSKTKHAPPPRVPRPLTPEPWSEPFTGAESPGPRGNAHPPKSAETMPAPAWEAALPSGRLLGDAFVTLTTTRFYGREAELGCLEDLFLESRTRLLTVTGPGGTGKTRLALEAACRWVGAASGRENGGLEVPCAAFVPLAEAGALDRLYPLILRAFGGAAPPGRDPLERLAEVLNGRPGALLILDNFEHLAEAGASHVRGLLSRAPEVRCLVTSRRKLLIEGEREFILSPLPVGSGENSPLTLMALPAIRLFVDRAQAVRPDFQLTVRNAGAVAELCDRLEGIPLALELAAARVQVLSVAQILERTRADRLDFLASRRSDVSSRHRTLRATLDWSHDLLAPEARRFLARLSVFRGGWTFEAAGEVAGESSDQTLELLSQLRDASLVRVTDEAEGIRFHFLETVREYAQDCLRKEGAEEEACRAHADHFLRFAESVAHTELEQRLLEGEMDNLRAALDWTMQSGADELRGRLGLALWQFLNFQGHTEDVFRWFEELKDPALVAGMPLPVRAELLGGLGELAKNIGREGEAVSYFGASLDLYRRLGDEPGIAKSLNRQGLLWYQDPAAGRRALEEALEVFRRLGAIPEIASCLYMLALVMEKQGERAASARSCAEAKAIFLELGNRFGIGNTLLLEGVLALGRGDCPLARSRFEENLSLRRELHDLPGVGIAWNHLALLSLAEGRPHEAARLSEDALALFGECGWEASDRAGDALYHLALAKHELNDLGGKDTALRRGLTVYRGSSHSVGIRACLSMVAESALRRERPPEAARLIAANEVLRQDLTVAPESGEEERVSRIAATLNERFPDSFAGEEWIGRSLSVLEACDLALEVLGG